MANPGDTVQGKIVERVFPFHSKSNPDKSYECLLYTDGKLSCSCPGWTRRVSNLGRDCKHTALIEGMLAQESAGKFVVPGLSHPRTTKAVGRKFSFDD